MRRTWLGSGQECRRPDQKRRDRRASSPNWPARSTCALSENSSSCTRARSVRHYDALRADLHDSFDIVATPADLLDRALDLQRDLAHHHGMWHRTPIPDLLIAETALHHGLGVVHVHGDFERIADVRPLRVRRLKERWAAPRITAR